MPRGRPEARVGHELLSVVRHGLPEQSSVAAGPTSSLSRSRNVVIAPDVGLARASPARHLGVRVMKKDNEGQESRDRVGSGTVQQRTVGDGRESGWEFCQMASPFVMEMMISPCS